MRLFTYEAVMMGLLGGIVGYLLGYAMASWIAPWLIPGTTVEFTWWHPLLAVLAAITCSILATLYPAFFASRIPAAEAFRAL